MQTSLFLAKILGPLIVVLGVAMLTDRDAIRDMARDILMHRSMIFLAGFLGLLGGLALVNTHNVWAWDWRAIITILGWMSILSGSFRILSPGLTQKVGTWMMNSPRLLTTEAIILVGLGGWLSYAGYLA